MAEMVPCLMLPSSETYYDYNYFKGKGKIYKVQGRGLEVQTQLFKGSSQGCLITVDNSSSICLFGPDYTDSRKQLPSIGRDYYTDSRKQLPSIGTFPDVLEYRPERLKKEYLVLTGDDHCKQLRSSTWMQQAFIKKIVLSLNPYRSSDWLAMAIYNSNKVAYCKLGDREWKTVEGTCSRLHDIIHSDDRFYLVDEYGNVFFVLDMDFKKGSSPKLRPLTILPPKDFYLSKGNLYLVVSNWDLLMVDRDIDLSPESYKTVNFCVFKLPLRSCSVYEWSKLDCLGSNNMLFLGHNESFRMKNRDVKHLPRGNCIYFTDDYNDDYFSEKKREITGSDHGVFDLRDGSIRSLRLPLSYEARGSQIWPLPIWIQSVWNYVKVRLLPEEEEEHLDPAPPISKENLATLGSLEKRMAGIEQKFDTELFDINEKMNAMMKKIDAVLLTIYHND